METIFKGTLWEAWNSSKVAMEWFSIMSSQDWRDLDTYVFTIERSGNLVIIG